MVWRPGIFACVWPTASGRVGHMVRLSSSTLGCSSRTILRHCALRDLFLRLVGCATSSPNVTPRRSRNIKDPAWRKGSAYDTARLPTERDTCTGVIRTVTNALQQIITLKRKVAGLDKLMMTASGSLRPIRWLRAPTNGRWITSTISPSRENDMCRRQWNCLIPTSTRGARHRNPRCLKASTIRATGIYRSSRWNRVTRRSGHVEDIFPASWSLFRVVGIPPGAFSEEPFRERKPPLAGNRKSIALDPEHTFKSVSGFIVDAGVAAGNCRWLRGQETTDR